MDLGKLRNLSEHRTCQDCGAEFRTIPASKDGQQEQSALMQFSDHLTTHQPTGDQWATAHERIQAGKESAKAAG
jgi:hypothetical protein